MFLEGRRDGQLSGELRSGWLISYQGNQQRGRPLMAPLIRTITSWGPGQVYREAKHVSRVQVKQALVEQGITESKRTTILSGLTIHYVCHS